MLKLYMKPILEQPMLTLGRKISIPSGIICLSSISIASNCFFYHFCLTSPGMEFIPDLQSLIIKSSWSGITTYALLIITTLISKTLSRSFVSLLVSILLIFNLALFIKYCTRIGDVSLFYAALFYYLPSTVSNLIPGIIIERNLSK